MKQRRNSLLIGLLSAVITFAALAAFAKPVSTHGRYNHHCSDKLQNNTNKTDSLTNKY